jgi:SPP1 gp7 family putative phage head morphogenesis protein
MKLKDGLRIIDYIMEQADINDGINLKMEQNIINEILSEYDKLGDRILGITDIYGKDMKTLLQLQSLMTKIEREVADTYTKWYNILQPAVTSYYTRGYNQMDDLIQIGLDTQSEKQKIHEMQLNPDAYSIDYIKNHSFEMVKGISDDLINKIRSKLGMMLVANRYSKNNVSDAVEDILRTNRSRAQMIAQTEMSMAYNSGALKRMNEFNMTNDDIMKKYWYGFKYSAITCEYCRPRIGNIYDIDDDTESLPAHPRCRCVWLPYVEGWDTPISMDITRKADMLKRTLRPDEIYKKINSRLGINYADYMNEEDARKYISGDRSKDIKDSLANARQKKIDDTASAFDISSKSTTEVMNGEFSTQMNFWKKFTSKVIVDGDTKALRNSYEAIKGIMVLPWSAEQLTKWNNLLKQISNHF